MQGVRGQLPRWWRRVSGPRGRDVVIMLASLAATLLLIAAQPSESRQSWVVVGSAGLIGTAALGWRRQHSVTVTAVGIAVMALGGNVLPAGFALMRIAIVRRDRLLVGATVLVGAVASLPVLGSDMPFEASSLVPGGLGALFFALWGAYVGARRDLLTSLRERADRAEQERELQAEQARVAERSRIATEMHDVLAHKVSLIALQAGGLEVNPDAGAEVVEQTAALIRTTARQALEDLRSVLGVLRSDQSTGEGELAPQPGLVDLEQLVAASRAAGVRVQLDVQVSEEVPESLGRTVYRIVQEALTNVHKHARGAAAQVSVRMTDGSITVDVSNRRPVGPELGLPGSGSGLIGLAERVRVLGGSLDAGPTADGGWSVRGVLPDRRTVKA